MSGLYLVELASWLRAAGVEVVEYPGWQTRARGSGGFTGNRPWCVMWHHTASSASADSDASYIAEGSPDAPLANLLVARDGVVHVIAAGATNTNGKGYALRVSRGLVPDDQMNTHAVGIEIANRGTGETFPKPQIDACFASSLAIAANLRLEPDDCAGHWDWAPDRKVDPAVADAATGFWPSSVNSSGTWSLDDLRAECRARAGLAPVPIPPDPDPGPTPPSPGPPTEDDDMRITTALDKNGTIWVGNGINRIALDSMEVFSNYVVLGAAGSLVFVNTNGDQVRELGHVFEVGDDTIEALGVQIG